MFIADCLSVHPYATIFSRLY